MKKQSKTNKSLKVVSVNCNGISSKLSSFEYLLSTLKPSIFLLQESKMRRQGGIRTESSKNYIIWEQIRKSGGGGGLAVGIHKDLQPAFLSDGDDETEVIVCQIKINDLVIRILNGYGPQECDSLERKLLFWARLQHEVQDAEENGAAIMIMMDGNAHLGADFLKGDPNPCNHNGKLMREFLADNPSLHLLNGDPACQGVITRSRVKGSKTEQSAIDFAIVDHTLYQYFREMCIDEERKVALSNYTKRGKCVHSDHFTITTQFDISYKKKPAERQEFFNFKDCAGQKRFKEILDNYNTLSKCFENGDTLEDQFDQFCKNLESLYHQCFEKIRISDRVRKTEASELFERRAAIVQKLKGDSENESLKDELETVIKQLTNLVAKENAEKVSNTFQHFDQSNGDGLNQAGVWQVMKRMFPTNASNLPSAKIDVKNGKMVSDHEGLKHLYAETFCHRLRNRPGKEKYSHIYDLQQKLMRKRLILAQNRSTPDWSEDDIRKVLLSLKNGKARDPLGWCNEIFKLCGEDMVRSLTMLFNRIKNETNIPDKMRYKNVTALYKGKGPRMLLDSDRGIFTSTVLNCILQKLLLRDNYEEVDANLSDSNIGARKKKNIRNNTFVMNSVIHDAITNNKAIDIGVYDYQKMFDSMNLCVTTNDVYDVGIQDNHLSLMYASDSLSKVAIKTPVGLTQRVDILKTVNQGEVLSPLKATISVDSIARDQMENLDEHLYRYQGEVAIPPLGCVDDQITVSECGMDSAMVTSHINTMTNLKRLQFGPAKCFKLHIGKICGGCPDNYIDTWQLEKISDEVVSLFEMLDVESDRHLIELVEAAGYLGDVLQSSGKNTLNIETRRKRGLVAVNVIMSKLEQLTLGPYYFQTAVIFRNSLLLSTMLTNVESWFGLTDKEVETLEKVDEQLMRRIMSAHSKTAIPALYLELGCVPIRFIIMQRRIGFLWYILNEPENSLIRNVFNSQLAHPAKGDWCTQVRGDLEKLGLHISFEALARWSVNELKSVLKSSVRKEGFKYLLECQKDKSKIKDIKYSSLKLQDYLGHQRFTTIKEKCLLFKARTRMMDLKSNFKLGQTNLSCSRFGTGSI